MKLHELKIKHKYLLQVNSGRKTFELRKNDRDYQVGDLIHFIDLNDEKPTYHKNYMGFYMTINLSKERETPFYVSNENCIKSQQDIDNLQIAFNNVKRDFEEMKKYGD